MNARGDILSTRIRNRVTRLSMIVADMKRDAEPAMALEIRKGGSL